MQVRAISARAVALAAVASLVFAAVIVEAPIAEGAELANAITLTSVTGTFGTPLTLTSAPTTASTGAITYQVISAGAAGCSIAAGELNASTAGTCSVEVTQADDGTYVAASDTETVTFGEAANAIALTSLTGTLGTPLTLTSAPTTASTGAITYQVISAGAAGCSIAAGELNASTAGTCSVEVTQADDGNYVAASDTATVTFSAASVTITFNAEGGTPTPASMSGPNGSTITLPGAPTLAGSTFGGWFSAATGGTKANSPYTLTGSLTLYAHWTTNASVTITFNAEGGTPTPASMSGPNGSTITLPGAPTLAGSTFGGWFSAATGGTKANSPYTLTGSLTLYAHWTTNASVTITFNAEGGTPTPASMSGPNGSTITLPGAPTLAGSTFGGWFSAATGGTKANSPYTLTGSLTLYAHWTTNASVTITFNAEGGTPTPASMSGPNGSTITLPGAPTLAGSTFGGWFSAATGGTKANSPYTLTGSLTLYAHWTTNASGGGGPPSVTLVQTSPTSGVTTTDNSDTFTAGPITVSNATGAVSFAVTASSTALSVSPQGAITTTGTLLAGSYSISGIDSDLSSDAGAWTYTLTVNNPSVTVTFNANGGTGSMAPESENTTTPLIPNVFTQATHAFTEWNTAANGSGVSYANGATYSFVAPVTLYAQWATTKHRAVSHRVTFDANGGTGTMALQSNSVLTLLKPNAFTRASYTFREWNTKSDGSGKSYANGAAYSFAKSSILYAQWVKKVTTKVTTKATPKVTIKVTFRANGGHGTMTDESKTATGALTPSHFTRSGYNFTSWNTKGDGSGTSYANGAPYSFAKSTTLYAQWSKKADVTIQAIDGVVTLSPFIGESAKLSSTLQTQVINLAVDINANHDTKIALVGFSGDLTTANETNEEAWAKSLKLARARADAVETFLKQQLAMIGVTGYTITAKGSSAALPVSLNSTAALRAENRKVVATLS